MSAFLGEIHPLAAEWPMMPDEEIDALAESIQENGLRQPIVTTLDGVLIDGRNRLEACHRAGISPRFISDPSLTDDAAIEDYIADANAERRNVSTGQKAMSRARVLARRGKRKNGRWARGSIGNTEVRVTAEGRTWLDAIRLAGLVMDWRPDLAGPVIGGGVTLNDAVTKAEAARDAEALAEAARRAEEERLQDLRESRPDLLELVESERLPLADALTIRDRDLANEEKAVRERQRRIFKFSTDVCSSIVCLEPLHQFPHRREQVEQELDFAVLSTPITANDISNAIESLQFIAAVLNQKEK